MPGDTFGNLLHDYTRYPLLNAAQELTLSRTIQRGRQIEAEEGPKTKKEKNELRAAKRAKDKLLKCNLRLVVHMSKRYFGRLKGRGMDQCDLVQEGILGLSRACDLFDYSRGYKFSTYAYWWIRQALTRSTDQLDRLCRIPSHQIDTVYKAIRAQREYEQEHGRSATPKQLADIVGKSEEDLVLLLQRNLLHVSLDAPMNDEGNCLLELLADESHLEADDRLELVLSVLGQLKPAEYEIICSVYELNGHTRKNHGEIAKERGTSREYVRQQKERATKKLRLAVQNRYI